MRETKKSLLLLGGTSVLLVFFLATLWVIGTPLSRDGDLWLHRAVGEKIVAHFPASLSKLTEVHSWLGEVVFFEAGNYLRAVYGGTVLTLLLLVGGYLLRATHTLLLVPIIGLALFALVRESGDFKPALFGTILLVGVQFVFFLRPRRLSLKLFLALSFVQVVWINLHGSGLLLLPLVTLYAFFCAKNSATEKRRFILGLGLVTFLNPLGWGIYSSALKLSQLARESGVTEWQWMFPLHFAEGLRLGIPLQADSLIWVGLLLFGLVSVAGGWRRELSLYKWISFFIWLAISALALRFRIFMVIPLVLAGELASCHLQKKAIPAALISFGLIAAAFFPFRLYQSDISFVLPVQASRFIKEVGVRGKSFNEQTWGGYLESNPNLEVGFDTRVLGNEKTARLLNESRRRHNVVRPAEVLSQLPDTDLIIHRSDIPWRRELGGDWQLIFENNLVSVLLKRNDRNRENLSRVQRYYRTVRIPFDTGKDFSLREAFQTNRGWVNGFSENRVTALWPTPERQTLSVLEDAQFYDRRGLPQLTFQILKNSLQTDPENSEIALALGLFFVQMDRLNDAEHWLHHLEALHLPNQNLIPLRVMISNRKELELKTQKQG